MAIEKVDQVMQKLYRRGRERVGWFGGERRAGFLSALGSQVPSMRQGSGRKGLCVFYVLGSVETG